MAFTGVFKFVQASVDFWQLPPPPQKEKVRSVLKVFLKGFKAGRDSKDGLASM